MKTLTFCSVPRQRQVTVAVLALLLFVSGLQRANAATDRIVRAIDSTRVTQLKGNVHPLAKAELDRGAVSPSMTMERVKLVFTPTAAQQSSLDTFLAQLQDRNSPNYHKWLTPEQFADRYSVSSADYAKVAAWLRSQDFTISEMPPSRTYIAFDGTAAQVESVFRTQIHQFELNGEMHFANVTEPSIPSALVGVVTHIGSLHNFKPKPLLTRPHPHVTSSFSGNHFLAPGDFAEIYNVNGLYGSGIDGTGQTIAVIGQTDLVTSGGIYTDVATFRSLAGLSAPNVTTKLVSTTDPGVVSGDIDEANLDVEWSGGIAKNAAIIFVVSNNGAFDALEQAISQNLAPVVSISYGICEAQAGADLTTLKAAADEAALQGQTIVSAAGDSGAADCDYSTSTTLVTSATQGLAVDFPGSIPTVTSIGGNEFDGDVAGTVSPNPCTTPATCSAAATTYWAGSSSLSDPLATALIYIPEEAWNDTSTTNGLSAGGGGTSTQYPQPSWQSGLSAITNGMRGVPDISFSASADHDSYLICSQGSCVCGWRNSCTVDTTGTTSEGSYDAIGGTSAGTPSFAGIVALLNQQTNSRQGNVNPSLYAAFNSSPSAFHDITTGNNIVPCTTGTPDCTTGSFGYRAGAGYDLATGLGSIDAAALVAAISGTAAGFTITPPSPSLSIAPGGTATDTLTITPSNSFSETVTLSCAVSSGLTGTSCSVLPTTISGGSGTATLTITVASGATSSLSGTVTITGTSTSETQTASVTVSVPVPDFTIAAANSTMSLASGGSGTNTLTVTGTNGFSGTVSLACSVSSGLGSTTCSVSPGSVTGSGTATLTVNGAVLSGHLRRASPFSPERMGLESGFLFAGFLLFGGGAVGARNRHLHAHHRRRLARWSGWLGLLLSCGLLLVAIGCGGGGSSGGGGGTVNPLSGTVTVTATSGSLSHTTSISVNIN